MTTSIRRLYFGAVGLAMAAAVAPTAWAGCGDAPAKAPAAWQSTPGSEATPLLTKVALPATTPSIVGMWSVTLHSGGHIIDFGYSQWHADGTEIMFSGGRPPSTADVCLGVWTQTGPSTYSLNHLALGYDTSGNLNSKNQIKEQVTLRSEGNLFSGPFTIDVFDPKTGSPLQHIAGTITAQRVTVNSAP